eukprot:TRINITY_DN63695_c0_g1_i1.p1 TRINITY_DN63695_c0_g1~~TRINITY_DN63695_c0_g1_i1.p1  ORF type:complete len:544 (-),score=59.15 TRINITY_DN63695_c0_g1_i1:116-1696(-)
MEELRYVLTALGLHFGLVIGIQLDFAPSVSRPPASSGCEAYVSDFIPSDELNMIQTSKLRSIRSLNLSMLGGIYGEKVCPGNVGRFITDKRDAPPDFCEFLSNQPKLNFAQGSKPLEFDQFALERVMLARWYSMPKRCDNAEDASIVVLPSFQLQSFMAHFDGQQTHFKDMMHLHEDAQRRYWEAVRNKYYRPGNYTPIIIVHLSTTVWLEQVKVFIRELMKQPAEFVERVVIAALESNMMRSWNLSLPTTWKEDARLQHASLLASTTRLGQHHDAGLGPLLVAMPYPIPVFHTVSFLKSSGAYDASKPRKILIAAQFSAARGDHHSWIRTLLMNQVTNVSGRLKARSLGYNKMVVCDHSANSSCGLSALAPTLWDVTVNSAFCLQPAGDTLTRSHFYLAVLSGCVPVIFDGGHDRYQARPTAWAWRKIGGRAEIESHLEDDLFVDYSDFAVVYNVTDVRKNRRDVIRELSDLLLDEPDRYLALRRKLEQVAPRMRYNDEQCSEEVGSDDDAFCHFRRLVLERTKF